MPIFLSILIAIFIILFAGFMVGRFYSFFAKYRWLMLIIALVYGTIIYAIAYWLPTYTLSFEAVLSVALQSLFSAGRFFIFDTDLGLIIANPIIQSYGYIIAFGVAGLFAMFAMATAVLSLFGMSAVMYFKCTLSPTKSVYVFVGADKNSIPLALDLKRKEKKSTIIIVIDVANTPNYKEIQRLCGRNKLILINKNIDNVMSARQVFLPKLFFKRMKKSSGKLSVLLMSNDKSVNAGIATATLKANNFGGKNAIMYCQCDTIGLEKTFDDLNATNWQLRLFNYQQLVAEMLISEHPVIDYLTISGNELNIAHEPRILIAGDGELFAQIMRAVVNDTQFENYLPNITVWGQESSVIIGQLLQQAPEARKCVNFNYIGEPIGNVEFYRNIKDNEYDYIVIASRDEGDNIKTACLIREQIAARVGVFAYSSNSSDYLIKKDGGYENIELFGETAKVLSTDVILNGKLDNTGIAVNKYYSNGKDDYYSKKIMEKNSNKSFGLNIPTKLKLLGLELCSCDAQNVMSGDEFRAYVGDNIEMLARQEHMRWNAFHYMNGYKTWRVEDIPKDYNKTKTDSPKLHACLVSFDELDAVSERFHDKVKDVPQGYKGYDIILVERIVEILNYCGLSVKLINEPLNNKEN